MLASFGGQKILTFFLVLWALTILASLTFGYLEGMVTRKQWEEDLAEVTKSARDIEKRTDIPIHERQRLMVTRFVAAGLQLRDITSNTFVFECYKDYRRTRNWRGNRKISYGDDLTWPLVQQGLILPALLLAGLPLLFYVAVPVGRKRAGKTGEQVCFPLSEPHLDQDG